MYLMVLSFVCLCVIDMKLEIIAFVCWGEAECLGVCADAMRLCSLRSLSDNQLTNVLVGILAIKTHGRAR